MSTVATKLSKKGLAYLCATILMAVAGIWAAMGIEEHLTGGGFKDTDSSSFQAHQELEEELGVGAPNVIVRIASQSTSMDSAEVLRTAIDATELVSQYAAPNSVQSYWSTGLQYLKATDAKSALILASIPGDAD